MYNPADHYWIVADHVGDEVYSSARQAYVSDDDAAYTAWIADGGLATPIPSHAELVAVLRNQGVPPFHRVPTYTIVTRLQSAGIADVAMTALQADPVAYARFFTADSRGGIDADAADVRAFLTAIGADVEAVLAPA